ncbi:MAG: aminopeptidase [Gammaproteobacteria bacterium]|nr:aminopeptidase [Gammaproteobacteria bacterium]
MLPGRVALVLICVLDALATGGCSSYLRQAVAGQIQLMRQREPVAEVLADGATPSSLRAGIAAAQAALDFAHRELELPDNGSYRSVVMLDRPQVVWNVFAAPEFSLVLREWCFPVAGCVTYRGYFAETAADAYAARLAQAGNDVSVIGASAYSTLGYFRDPLLSTVLSLSDRAIAGLIFHELAHQRVYARGDTPFNEGVASLVEQEGMLLWLETRGDQPGLCRYALSLDRERLVQDLVADARRELRQIYRGPGEAGARRAAKATAFERLRENYRRLRATWSGPPHFDRWFSGPLNNAVFGAASTYNRHVDVLRVIFESEGRDWSRFFRRMDRLARLSAAERSRVLAHIERPTARRSPAGCGQATAG